MRRLTTALLLFLSIALLSVSLLQEQQEATDKAEKLFHKAIDYSYSGNAEKAIELYTKYIIFQLDSAKDYWGRAIHMARKRATILPLLTCEK